MHINLGDDMCNFQIYSGKFLSLLILHFYIWQYCLHGLVRRERERERFFNISVCVCVVMIVSWLPV